MSAPLATNDLWYETFPELVARWFNAKTSAERLKLVNSARISIAAEERSRTLMEHARVKPLPKLTTARQWDVRWEPKAAWEHVRKGIRRFNWDCKRTRTSVVRQEMMIAAQELDTGTGGAPLVLVEDRVLETLAAKAKAGGLLLKASPADLAPLVLARELFWLAAEAKPMAGAGEYLDELACHDFVERLLGLPFSPMVFDFLPDPPRPPRA